MMTGMNTRTTKLAAAGLLALTLPLAPSAEAVPLYRFDQPRSQSVSGVAPLGPGAGLAGRVAEALSDVDESSRAAYESAIDDADAALERTCAVLVAVGDDETPAWQVLTEVGEAETGLLAARAHVKFVRDSLAAGAPRAALDAVEGQLSDLLGVLEAL